MSTERPRIQVTLDTLSSKQIGLLATQQATSLSTVAAELIREALELREDRALSELGDRRMKETTRWLSHRDVWGED